MNNKSNKMNFIKLTSEYNIVIPIMQRDYAQGRKEEKNKRELFLKAIKESIDKKTGLNMDFIYGATDKEENKLYLVDGQQRLTTLFLLYVYALSFLKNEPKDKINLRKFTYEIRTSSRMFCEKLIDEIEKRGENNELIERKEKREDNNYLFESRNPSQVIENQNWFLYDWRYDPTIEAMLVMLDDIAKTFSEYTTTEEKRYGLYEGLNAITFEFLQLEQTEPVDDLYIKMNKRGRQLTTFENFKAKLEEYMDKNNSTNIKDFKSKIDKEWLLFLWEFLKKMQKQKNDSKIERNDNNITQKVDNIFMVIILIIATNIKAENLKLENKEEKKEGELSELEKLNDAISSEKKLEFEEIEGLIGRQNIEKLKNVLYAILEFIREYKDENNEFKNIISVSNIFGEIVEENSEYKILIEFYAITKMIEQLEKCKNNVREERAYKFSEEKNNLLNKMLFVVRNLCENTIFNNIEDYVKAIQTLRKIIEKITDNNLEIILEENECKGFEKQQIIAEKNKLSYIGRGTENNSEWLKEIVNIDMNEYLKGQTGFIFLFTGKELTEEEKKDEVLVLDKYRSYAKKINDIFDEERNKYGYQNNSIEDMNNELLFERALLCQGDYLYGNKSQFFLNDRTGGKNLFRDFSWKRLLCEDDITREALKSFKSLIDLIEDFSKEQETKRKLRDIIDKYIKENDNELKIGNYRLWSVKYPEVMKLTRKDGMVGYFLKSNENDIYLSLRATNRRGKGYDFYLCALYLAIKEEQELSHIKLDGNCEEMLKMDTANEQYKKAISINDGKILIEHNAENFIIKKRNENEDEEFKARDFETIKNKLEEWSIS